VIFGCANQAGEDNRNVAHMATLLAGYPQTVPAPPLTACADRVWMRSALPHAPSKPAMPIC
jgi:hypothetical protein